MSIDPRGWFDLLTAGLWFALASIGVALRVRRLVRLHRVALPRPIVPADRAYLASVKRSTYLRLGVKLVFLVGSLIALFGLDVLWPVWRVGIVAALAFMLAETVGVDAIRDRLGRVPTEAG